jgi:hypothetical protein
VANKFRNGGVPAGTTSLTTYVYLENADGSAATGLAYNTSGLVWTYTRGGAAPTTVTKVTQTATGGWTSGGFAEVDSTLTPGLYRLDVPDATFAQGDAESVMVSIKGSGLRAYHEQIPLTLDTTLTGTAATGTLTTTSFTTAGLPTLTTGQLNRRLLEFTSGACAGERVLIVGQTSGNQLQVAPPLTTAPSNGDRFQVL